MSTINPVPNDDDLKLAEQTADAFGLEVGEGRARFIAGCAVGVAGARMVLLVRDLRVEYCEALLALCAQALANSDPELPGGRAKTMVRSCICDLQAAGVEVPK